MIKKYFKPIFFVFFISSLLSACGQQNANNSTINKAAEMASQTALANMITTEIAKIAATSYQSTKTISDSLTNTAPTATMVIHPPELSTTPPINTTEKWRVNADTNCDGSNEFYMEYNLINDEFFQTDSSNMNYEYWGKWKITGNQLIFIYNGIVTFSPNAVLETWELNLFLTPDPDMCIPNMKDYYNGRLVAHSECGAGERIFNLNGNSMSMENVDTLYGEKYCYNGERITP